MSEVSTTATPQASVFGMTPKPVSPARQYLRDLPGVFAEVLRDLGEARRTAAYLLPFTWRSSAASEREDAEIRMFDLGRTWDKGAEAGR